MGAHIQSSVVGGAVQKRAWLPDAGRVASLESCMGCLTGGSAAQAQPSICSAPSLCCRAAAGKPLCALISWSPTLYSAHHFSSCSHS